MLEHNLVTAFRLARAWASPEPAGRSQLHPATSSRSPGRGLLLANPAGRTRRHPSALPARSESGAAGLVNAFDPDIVTVGAWARTCSASPAGHLYPAYLAGLMRFRASAPPPLVPARLATTPPSSAPRRKASRHSCTDHGLQSWAPAGNGPKQASVNDCCRQPARTQVAAASRSQVCQKPALRHASALQVAAFGCLTGTGRHELFADQFRAAACRRDHPTTAGHAGVLLPGPAATAHASPPRCLDGTMATAPVRRNSDYDTSSWPAA